MGPKPIVVREVWQHNLIAEFFLIQKSLLQFPYASMDTEFPGTIFHPNGIPRHLISSIPPQEFYSIMKLNVDALNIIQLGITLSDAHGNLPDFGTGFQYVWEFNFRDFDSDYDLQNPESISLLKRQGIDFLKNKKMGIDSSCFAMMFKISGLGLCLIRSRSHLTWITFHGPYDFGFLIKILTRSVLPDDLNTFMKLVKLYFGEAVYDLKMMARCFGLHGGLERVANGLNVDRVAGRAHQSGSDSLLTIQAFVELRKKYFREEITTAMEGLNYKLYGLTTL